MRWHIHRDRNWREDAGHRYFRCRCGATRIVEFQLRGVVIIEDAGWPSLEDRHGRRRRDSGWQMGYPRSDPDWKPIWETDPNWEFPSAALIIPQPPRAAD